MIYLCTDFQKTDLELLLEKIPLSESLRIKNRIKNRERQLQSAAAWALLCFALNLGRNTETARDDNGKPLIIGKNSCFSLSHCPECVAVAVSDSPIGVDVETISAQFPVEVANRIFSAEICEKISKSSALNVEFYYKWTQFESFIKAGEKASDFQKSDQSLFQSTTIDGVALSFYSQVQQTVERISVATVLSRRN